MRYKEENYAYLDDKDVLTDDVLTDIFDDGEYTFGKPDHEAVGFILGYPFYATYSELSNELVLQSFYEGLSVTSEGAINEHLTEVCNIDPELEAVVTHLSGTQKWGIYFYFKNAEN